MVLLKSHLAEKYLRHPRLVSWILASRYFVALEDLGPVQDLQTGSLKLEQMAVSDLTFQRTRDCGSWMEVGVSLAQKVVEIDVRTAGWILGTHCVIWRKKVAGGCEDKKSSIDVAVDHLTVNLVVESGSEDRNRCVQQILPYPHQPHSRYAYWQSRQPLNRPWSSLFRPRFPV